MGTVLFYISKLLRPVLASPLFLVLLTATIGLFLLKAETVKRRVLKVLAVLACLALWTFSLPFTANRLARAWERPLSDPRDCLAGGPYTAIVVLGGMADPERSEPGSVSLNGSAERLTAAAELYRGGAAAAVIVSGGSGSIAYPKRKEAPFMAELLGLMGVPAASIVQESESRNTHENALYSKQALAALGQGRIVLVTSAWHMPRSEAIFKKAGFDFYAFSTDSLELRDSFPASYFPDAWALERSTILLREWIGFMAYRMMGRL